MQLRMGCDCWEHSAASQPAADSQPRLVMLQGPMDSWNWLLYNTLMSLDLPADPVRLLPKNYFSQRWEDENQDQIRCLFPSCC